MLKSLTIRQLAYPSGDLLDLEVVERKGLGHPDTICDEIAEQLSLTLSRLYLAECGEVLHHNVDKVLLAGDASSPRFGGGAILAPIELFLAGRATASFQGKTLPVEDLAHQVAADWFSTYLPAIDAQRGLKVHNLVRPGSADLSNLFARRTRGGRLSNDSSCGVGYAPLSRLETVVYAVEKELGAASFSDHPEIGRDIKVMGVRQREHIHLTIACALVDRSVHKLAEYVEAKATVATIAHKAAQEHGAFNVSVRVNAADDPAAGSVYLTVTGTSAEAGDDGEARRGSKTCWRNGASWSPTRPFGAG